MVADLASKVNGLLTHVASLDSRANRNAAAIINLQVSNKELLHKNSKFECDVVSLNGKVGGLTMQLTGIDQHLKTELIRLKLSASLNRVMEERLKNMHYKFLLNYVLKIETLKYRKKISLFATHFLPIGRIINE